MNISVARGSRNHGSRLKRLPAFVGATHEMINMFYIVMYPCPGTVQHLRPSEEHNRSQTLRTRGQVTGDSYYSKDTR